MRAEPVLLKLIIMAVPPLFNFEKKNNNDTQFEMNFLKRCKALHKQNLPLILKYFGIQSPSGFLVFPKLRVVIMAAAFITF